MNKDFIQLNLIRLSHLNFMDYRTMLQAFLFHLTVQCTILAHQDANITTTHYFPETHPESKGLGLKRVVRCQLRWERWCLATLRSQRFRSKKGQQKRCPSSKKPHEWSKICLENCFASKRISDVLMVFQFWTDDLCRYPKLQNTAVLT